MNLVICGCCNGRGMVPATSVAEMIAATEDRLLADLAERGMSPVIGVDGEAVSLKLAAEFLGLEVKTLANRCAADAPVKTFRRSGRRYVYLNSLAAYIVIAEQESVEELPAISRDVPA